MRHSAWLDQIFLRILFSFLSTSEPCGGTIVNETSGFILSPNHPERYPNNLKCNWTIVVDVDERIYLTVRFYYVSLVFILDYFSQPSVSFHFLCNNSLSLLLLLEAIGLLSFSCVTFSFQFHEFNTEEFYDILWVSVSNIHDSFSSHNVSTLAKTKITQQTSTRIAWGRA